MGENIMGSQLPAGFTLDQQTLPEGFVLDTQETTIEPQQELPKGSPIDQVLAPVSAIAGGIGGSVAGGWAGIYDLIKTGDIDSAVKATEEMRDKVSSAIAVEPDTQEAQRGMELLRNSLSDIEKAINFATGGAAGLAETAMTGSIDKGIAAAENIQEKGLGKALGEQTLEATGSPLLATGAEILPAIGEMVAGKYIGRGLDGVKPKPDVEKTPEEQLIDVAAKEDVPVLTTDVFPPESWMGKQLQRISEKLGPLGSGPSRMSQQKARQDAVQNLADEFDVQIDSPFFDEVIDSLTTKSARTLQKGNRQRREAIDSLSPYGEVPTIKSSGKIDDLIQKQEGLGEIKNQSLIDDLTKYKNTLEGRNFDEMAAVRTEVIGRIKDLEKSDLVGTTKIADALRDTKKAIDDDMLDFAKLNDRNAASQWLKANRNLSDELTKVKRTELKRLIEKGDVKPEIVSTILKSGNRSELTRLNRSLTAKGKASARAAIVKDVLDKSGFFKDDLNPSKLATELGRTKTKQAVDILFDDKQKSQLDGLEKLLNATRRAQDAQVSPETGAALIPFAAASGFGAGVTQSPLLTIATTGTLSGLAKAYESKPFRNLLIRLSKSKKGSPQEKKILESAMPLALAGLQVARQESLIESIPE